MTVLTVIAAIVVLAAIVARRWRWALGAFGAWVALGVGIIGLAILNQALFVNPNPLDQQRRYIANDIAATRTAFGLDAWTTRSYPATTSLPAAAIVSEADTFANARLWDDHPLRATLDQLQTVRQYYDFTDVDIDRYPIDGEQREVMLSAREMALDKNPAVANWLNSHFVYTHGYGARDGARVGSGLRRPARSHHPRPAGHVRGGRADGHRAADLLRGAAVPVDHHRRPDRRVRLPGRTGGRMPRRAGPRRRAST